MGQMQPRGRSLLCNTTVVRSSRLLCSVGVTVVCLLFHTARHFCPIHWLVLEVGRGKNGIVGTQLMFLMKLKRI